MTRGLTITGRRVTETQRNSDLCDSVSLWLVSVFFVPFVVHFAFFFFVFFVSFVVTQRRCNPGA